MSVRLMVTFLLITVLFCGIEGCSTQGTREPGEQEQPMESAPAKELVGGDASEAAREKAPETTPEVSIVPEMVGLPELQPVSPKTYPLDDLLRLNHVQVLGTHNSYHIAPSAGVKEWMYTNEPLDIQLEKQGVRQFELDIHWDKDRKLYQVYHIPLVDTKTTCDKWTDCLRVIKYWSDRRPQHLPIFVMIETKFGPTQEPPDMFGQLERETLQVFPKERIITPDFVRGQASSLKEALKGKGWPTLKQVRGKILFFLLTSSKREMVYTNNGKSLKGRLMFVNTKADRDYAAVQLMDSPVGNEKKIQDAVRSGLLIRTRADSDLDASKQTNEKRLQAALQSGAHMLSSDHPTPRKDGYVAKIPGGTPARCNPVTAPKECTSKALEDHP